MRRFLPLVIGVTVMLLAGCESKREICAKAMSGEYRNHYKVAKKLGIKNAQNVWKYCEYYKN